MNSSADKKTIPISPDVRVLPGSGKSFEQFQTDDAVCRQCAGESIGVSPQETVSQRTATGAVFGSAVGAVIGAVIGALLGVAGGDPGTSAVIGVAIGAGSGLLFGITNGASAGNTSGWETQGRYDNSYVQCMHAKGNQAS